MDRNQIAAASQTLHDNWRAGTKIAALADEQRPQNRADGYAIQAAIERFSTTHLFGWKIEPFPGSADYWHIDTGGADDSPDGALKRRKHPQEPVVNYVSVDSVDKFADKIAKLGGKICMAKTAVPQMGYFAVCQDTEGNAFGLWESDPAAA